ncbi:MULTISPECIES: glutamate-5-semialdehyde dehydrogenase [unclassified Novosphingobium]|uniref:glutamate-5-semialdehyde dehydrogenase n=1 Tax=unclassified Novosphingobium TaxID=2644732 RepID=UPI000ECE6AB1|nr:MULTISPECIES: glutamate-5-semialdehyde dehydrogenase [unclassified Novosphingobium]HCF24284.1 glutamate-5-semialdehyde dehydrogenase [Novosphingobium sp.]HQV02467.1 glutamate-5-semialdehyde dehydrogenase [Novosphingobium sp.]
MSKLLPPDDLIAQLARAGREAQRALGRMSHDAKAQALRVAAAALRKAEAEVLAANAEDLAAGEASGLSPAMLDRLMLDSWRLAAIADAVENVADLADPVGQEIERSTRPNGLVLSRVRVPVGLIGIIYESRPNVTADAAALCVASGNAVLLRGGSEAVRSNRAIHAALVRGLTAAGIPAAAVQLVPTQDRAAVGAMLTAAGLIDMIVPRGGKSLVARVQADARVPVLAHLDGINHTYIHAAADPAKAIQIAINAKLRRTGVCGAMETLLLDAQFPAAPAVVAALLDSGCELRGDARARALDPRIGPASAEDWDTEYLDSVLSVAVVDGLDAALAHIAAHGSQHTEAIVSEDETAVERFLSEVDSAIVMANASTQFADGGEFGLGAEIGIATGRLHARGPVALEGLTTYKWLVRGTGQIRP